jgi:addiction module RelE/StbE family toxin
MKVIFKKSFQKSLKKLPIPVQEKFDSRFRLFLDNESHPLLRNHSVHPTFKNGRSISITGDYRAVYVDEVDRIIFITIGTHSELYG